MRRSSTPIIPLERESVADQVARILRESILTQTFSPGERLNPNEVAAKLGVSITPVKDAVTRLVSEGLIEIRPRSGTFVSAISLQDLTETFELRAALECLAAERVIAKLTPELISRFRDLMADLEKPVHTTRERTWHEQKNAELHQLIIDSAGNRKLRELHQTLNTHITIARIHSSRQDWSDRLAEENAEHRAILRAIESRDRDRLVTLLRRHIERASANLVEDLEKSVSPIKLATSGSEPSPSLVRTTTAGVTERGESVARKSARPRRGSGWQ